VAKEEGEGDGEDGNRRQGRTASMENATSCLGMQKSSVYADCEQEIQRYKWIASEKAGRDLGEAAERRWVKEHWWGYLRSRWLEHLEGKHFWVELDHGDFGFLLRTFDGDPVLLDRVLDRIKAGQENLDIIRWAHDFGIPIHPLIQILEMLDINSRRLAARRFDS
jgi:hypothetical protein